MQKSVNKRKILISRIKRKFFKHVWFTRLLIILTVILTLFILIISAALVFRNSKLGFYTGLGSDFVLTPEDKIKSFEGRTNILILGKGGKGHEAPDLTDTMILASVSNKSDPTVFVSLPRDIWIPDLRAKINSAYYWGKQKGGGLILAKSTVEEIVGIPVQYGIVVDFSGFKGVIDNIGGVDVDVERSFVDEKYPIPGYESDQCNGDKEFHCRYETIRFEKGIQHMDGETALKFVRSRNAGGDEGTDLARAARQQKVIRAIRDKVLKPKTLLSVKRIKTLLKTVTESIETDLDLSNIAILARHFLKSKEKINSYVLPQDFLINPPISGKFDNQYVFIPQKGDWSDLHGWINCIIEQGENCETHK